MVDIHSHLLPGLDDGPEALGGALEMARAAAEAGTRVIAATPHLRPDFPSVNVGAIGSLARLMAQEVEAAGIDLAVIPGAECSLLWALEASDEELAHATYRQLGHDLLVETPIDVSMLEEMLYRVRLRGVRVTLAHPERSGAFKQDPRRLERLHEQGIVLQINAGALLLPRSSTTRRLAEHLCFAGLADVIASDGHRGAGWRPVSSMGDGFEALSRLVGPERAGWMARDAPAAVLEGRPLPAAPAPEAPRRRLWSRGRG